MLKKVLRVLIGLTVISTVGFNCLSMAAQKVTKVTFWHPYGTPVEEKAIKKSTDLFNRQNPNIQVKAVFAGSSGD